MLPVALTIAGSDPSGGAGIQADLKTFHQFGVYGEAVITLLTVQNTLGVHEVAVMDAGLVARQMEAVLDDVPPDAIKTGALGGADVIDAVAGGLARSGKAFPGPLVIDPVLSGTAGKDLLATSALQAMKQRLFPLAHLITPNLREAAALAGMEPEAIRDLDAMREAARVIQATGARNILLKGGHLDGDAIDLLLTGDGRERIYSLPRIAGRNTHGTGCTLAAAITALLARGVALEEAIGRAKSFVHQAIASAPGLGKGTGPLNHFADAGGQE